MAKSIPVTGEVFAEIKVTFAGIFQPGCAAWGGSRFEPPINPPEADSVEDIGVAGLAVQVYRSSTPGGKRIISLNLLEGIDTTNPEILKLFDNIIAALSEEAEEALSDIEDL